MHFNWRRISSNWCSSRLQVQEIKNKGKKKEKKGTDLWVAKGELQRVKSSEFMYMDMYHVLILLHKGDTCNPI